MWPYGFVRIPGECILRRSRQARTPEEAAADRFFYSDIEHYRVRYPVGTDVVEYVESAHKIELH